MTKQEMIEAAGKVAGAMGGYNNQIIIDAIDSGFDSIPDMSMLSNQATGIIRKTADGLTNYVNDVPVKTIPWTDDLKDKALVMYAARIAKI